MNKKILLNIISPPSSSSTTTLLPILENHGLTLLEISQSLICGYMNSTIVANINPECADTDFIEALEKSLYQHNHLCCYRYLNSSESFFTQTAGAAVLTVMPQSLQTSKLEPVFSAVYSEGVVITHTHQLSQYNADICHNKTCLELRIIGNLTQLKNLKQTCFSLSSAFDIDIVLQNNASKRKNYRLIAFDMDSTLIQAEVIDLLADSIGVGKQVADITEQTMRGELSFNDSFIHRLAMLKGLDEVVLTQIVKKIPLMDGAETLIKTLKSLGYKTAIISGGFTYFAEYLQRKLGIDYIHANELDIVNGKITGMAKEPIINSERKAQILQQLAFHEGLSLDQVIAVGDGANDLAMLKAAGLGIAFRAKPLVKQQAEHAISVMGLDSILFLLGLKETEFCR